MPAPDRPAATPQSAARGRGDRCPGALRLHQANDGALARIRVPGGIVTTDQMSEIACAATALGDGSVELTSRGNVQLRGLSPSSAGDLADRLYAAGLLPSVAHERARNVAMSPLTGLDGEGLADVEPYAIQFDEILCGTAVLAELSGRFLVAFDDGRLDVAALGADVTFVARPRAVAELLLAGAATGLAVPLPETPRCAAAAAEAFLAARARAGSDAWRVANLQTDLVSLVEDLRGRLGQHALTAAVPVPVPSSPGPGPRLGVVASVDGRTALSVALTLGRATAPAWAMLAEAAGHGTGRLRLTPWRGVIIPGLDPGIAPEQLAVLGGAGFLTSSDAPAAGVSACAGRPGCAQSLADVHAAAAAAFGAESRSAATRLPLHWSGCERRCGHPAGPRVEVVAQPGDHYRLERHDAASPSTPRDGACCTTTAVSKAAVSRAVAAARRHA